MDRKIKEKIQIYREIEALSEKIARNKHNNSNNWFFSMSKISEQHHLNYLTQFLNLSTKVYSESVSKSFKMTVAFWISYSFTFSLYKEFIM